MRTTLCFPAYFRVVGHSNFDFGAVPDACFDKTNNHPNLLLWPAVFAIPAHCPENNFSLKMPPFELMHIALHPRRLSFTHHCHGRISPIHFFATRPSSVPHCDHFTYLHQSRPSFFSRNSHSTGCQLSSGLAYDQSRTNGWSWKENLVPRLYRIYE
jgi:hypothetical protein